MRRSLSFVLATFVVAGCSSSPSEGEQVDSAVDEASDSARADVTAVDSEVPAEAAVDAGADALAEVGTDTANDTGADVLAEVAVDTGPEVFADTGIDAPADTATDASSCGDGGCPCPVLTVSCITGCCAVPAVELAPVGNEPAVAIDAAGYIYVAYSIHRSTVWGEGLSIFNPTTSKWTSTEIGVAGYVSRLIVSASGRVHLFYGGSANPYVYAFSDNHGATWTTRAVTTTAAIGGTGDLAIGAGDTPHVIYQAPTSSVWSALTYAVWKGTTWTRTTLDTATTEKDHPSISLGFADWPHIFAMAYKPDGENTSSVRHAFYDGAAWIYENVEKGGSYGTANDYYSKLWSRVFSDGSVRVVYTRTLGGTQRLVRADRTAGSVGAWTLTPLAGVTAPFNNGLLVESIAGAPAVLADGLKIYRPDSTGTFVAPAPTRIGREPSFAVSGSTLFVAYRSAEPSTSGRLYFTRFTF